MPRNALDYERIIDIAFQVASHYISDVDSVHEITQLTAIECLMNEEKVNEVEVVYDLEE